MRKRLRRRADAMFLRAQAISLVLTALNRESVGVQTLKSSDVAKKLKVDTKTVRAIFQDIPDMIRAIAAVSSGQIRAVRGGLEFERGESYYSLQVPRNVARKEAVARKVADEIEPGINLACSPGTTIALCIRELIRAGKYVSVLTNNCGIIDQIPRSQNISTLDVSGGSYQHSIHALIGNRAEQAFRHAHPFAALVGVSGLTGDGRLFVRHDQEVEVLKAIAFSATNVVYIAADVTKLTQRDTWEFAKIDQFPEGRRVFLITNPPSDLPDAAARSRAQQTYDSLRELPSLTIVDAPAESG